MAQRSQRRSGKSTKAVATRKAASRTSFAKSIHTLSTRSIRSVLLIGETKDGMYFGNRAWFKSKRLGWGYTPTNMKGGIVLLGYVAALIPTIVILNRIFGIASVGFAFWIALSVLAYSILLLNIAKGKSDTPYAQV